MITVKERFGAIRTNSVRALMSIGLVAVTAAAAATGFAAKLDVASERLTVVHADSKVPLSTCTVSASADTYLDESAPATAAGGAVVLKVRSQQSANQRALVRFDLSGCSIPQNASVRGARLDLYVATAPAASRSYAVHAATASWDEATATWNNQPTAAASATAVTATGTSADATLSWDVASDVAAFVSGATANNGWVMKDQTEGAADPGVGTDLAAREDASAPRRPTLIVSYYP